MISEAKLAELKKTIERHKNTQIKAEARLEELVSQKRETEEEIKALGYDPETLGEDLQKLEDEISELVAEIEALLPKGM